MRSRCPGRTAATLLLVAGAFVAIGCGSAGEPAEPTPGPPPSSSAGELSARDYVAAADQLCRAAMSEQEELRRQRGGKQITLRDRARLLVALAPVRARLAEDLAQLEPPSRQRRQLRQLAALAQRRAEASAEAGELFRAKAEHDEIAAAAAREHDARERFVALAREAGMADCGETLPQSAARAVRRSIAQGLGDPDAGKRCAVTSRRYIDQLYSGGLEECVAAGSGGWKITAVEISEIEGIGGVFAQARADVTGGGVTRHYRVRLTYEDDDYKIDKLD